MYYSTAKQTTKLFNGLLNERPARLKINRFAVVMMELFREKSTRIVKTHRCNTLESFGLMLFSGEEM